MGRSRPASSRSSTAVSRPIDSISDAGAILKGGAWIGALERMAVFAGLAAGFPEGVAVVLALKGVGRFPDLRGDAAAGGATTERFIIGTFTSVLWAAACAGMVALVRRLVASGRPDDREDLGLAEDLLGDRPGSRRG